MKFDSREEAKLWAIKHDDSRRHNTDEEKRYVLGQIYELEKAIGAGAPKGNRNASKNNLEESSGLISHRPHGVSDTIAEEHGVSHRTVEKAEKYKNAIDKLDQRGVINKADVLSGKVKIPAARVIRAAKEDDDEKANRPTSSNRRFAAAWRFDGRKKWALQWEARTHQRINWVKMTLLLQPPNRPMSGSPRKRGSRNRRIFDLWLACYPNVDIADVCGCDEKTVREVIGEKEGSPFSRLLDKNQQSSADHAADFQTPIYNVWKQQLGK